MPSGKVFLEIITIIEIIMVTKIRCSFIFLLILLLISGCNIPQRKAAETQTWESESTVAAYIQMIRADTPIYTPSPTTVLFPTDTQTPTPGLTPIPVFIPSATPTLGPDFFHGSLWYEPEFVSQKGLKYNGREVNTGCTAASVQMVLDFWHKYKNDYPTMTAQRLIDLNSWQNQFNAKTGLNIMNTEDELKEMNYYLGTRQDSSKEELLTALERYGPILVLTKVNWTPFGANHMAVVTGYDPENDMIRILDPWQLGGITEFPYENFDGIWSLNYLEDENDTLRRTFFVIVPYSELDLNNAPFVPYQDLKTIVQQQ